MVPHLDEGGSFMNIKLRRDRDGAKALGIFGVFSVSWSPRGSCSLGRQAKGILELQRNSKVRIRG